MEEDKIKDLFNNFDPELSSSSQFINKLKMNMEAVEIVKRHNLAMKKRNRLAVIIAAACGFIMGVILTLLYQSVGDWISTFSISIPHTEIDSVMIDYQLIAWIIMAVVSCITAINAYEIALTKLTPKESVV